MITVIVLVLVFLLHLRAKRLGWDQGGRAEGSDGGSFST